MLHLFEHAGFLDAHDPHHWWLYDARETSPKTCQLCLSLHGTHYRGDELELAFPFHRHMRVNTIKANAHMPRDPHCRCRLVWTGRTEDILQNPYGILKRGPEKPKVPKKVSLGKDEKRMFKRITRHARETYGKISKTLQV